MKKKSIITIVLSVLTVLIVIVAILLLIKNKNMENNSIKIIDATYSCNNAREKFYVDDDYVYYFPCVQSQSVFVKFSNGNKVLVTKALEDNKVTIDELIKAGLNVITEEKQWGVDNMDKKQVLELDNHVVYYVKTDAISYYITIPKHNDSTNICIELKSKMDNYNLDMNDEVWVMENVKNTFAYIDEYNITLVLPILDEDSISILEKIDQTSFETIDRLLGTTINGAYTLLKENSKEVNSEVILINNDRYKTFMNWFVGKYKDRVICKNLLEVIQMYNVNATSYQKLETPAITFVVGSYSTEVNAPKVVKEEETPTVAPKLVPQTSSGFTSYWLLAIITLLVSAIVAIIAFMS